MSTVRILDYGVGNIHSLKKALERSGLEVELTPCDEGPGDADGIVLPGVGAWTPAAKALEPARTSILDAVDDGLPLLGVCLGMQLLARTSPEGQGEGLGILDAACHRLQAPRIPHIGWNDVQGPTQGPLTALDARNVYYVHSYALAPDAPGVTSTTTYGETFAATVERENVIATQFHPEKSSHAGRIVMDAYADLVEGRA
ncbi:MAG: imidazole glycerol phosphate synthase subunit HisH [Candidatus Thermoplasmatota archaeon]|nr:imidazole glycerol phosphate synthase subunit HisH [Candidatus Thermoplasmatota archaeon]